MACYIIFNGHIRQLSYRPEIDFDLVRNQNLSETFDRLFRESMKQLLLERDGGADHIRHARNRLVRGEKNTSSNFDGVVPIGTATARKLAALHEL